MQMPYAIPIVIALGLLVKAEVATAQDQPEVTLPLPAETTIQSATPQQLSKAIRGAIRANPSRSIAIVARVFQSLGSEDKAKAAAAITAALMATPGTEILAIVRAAAGANPALAPTVAATAAQLFPRIAAAISRAAAEAAPGEARAIALAVAAIVPDQRDLIFASIRFSQLPRLDLGALGFAIEQGINPANYVGGSGAASQGRVTEPPAPTEPSEAAGPAPQRPQPSPTPVSSRPPPVGGGIVSPEN
jgi:hypothetical protein